MTAVFDAFSIFLLIVCVLLIAVVLLVAGVGARAWAEAIAALHKARAHGAQADAEEAVLKQAADAVEGVRDVPGAHADRYRPKYQAPTEEDLRASLLAQRLANEEENREYTTHGNEGFEDAEPIPGGGFYRNNGVGPGAR